MVNIFRIRESLLKAKLEREEIKSLRFNAKQRKVKTIESLHRKIAKQKSSRKLTPTQMAKRAKIKRNTKKALKSLSKFATSLTKEKKKSRGSKKKSAGDSFFS